MVSSRTMRWPGYVSHCLVAAFLFAGGSRASEPWAETELSRDVREWPILVAHPANPDLGALEKHFGPHAPKPNLYDLHHPDGALAVGTWKDGRLVLKILEAAELPGSIEPSTGVTYYGNRPRCLSLALDRTEIELPRTRSRESLPPFPALISLTRQGQLRGTLGKSPSGAMTLGEVFPFAADWAARNDVPIPARSASPPAGEELRVEILAEGLRVDGRETSPAALGGELARAITADPGRTIRLWSHPEASYGEVVAALDELYRAASPDARGLLRLAFQDRPPRPLWPKEPHLAPMVLKADAHAPFEIVGRVLEELAENTDRVFLLTALDVSEPGTVTAGTFPGGLPGGLVLPLAPAAEKRLPHSFDATGVRPPVKVYTPAPVYTEKARKARLEGVVVLQAVIGIDGKARDVKVLQGLGKGLDEKAIEAVAKWTFQPATLDGEPVAVYYNLSVRFRLP